MYEHQIAVLKKYDGLDGTNMTMHVDSVVYDEVGNGFLFTYDLRHEGDILQRIVAFVVGTHIPHVVWQNFLFHPDKGINFGNGYVLRGKQTQV